MASSVLKWDSWDPVRRSIVALRDFLCFRRVILGSATLRRAFIGIGLESLRSAKSPAAPVLPTDEEAGDDAAATGDDLIGVEGMLWLSFWLAP